MTFAEVDQMRMEVEGIVRQERVLHRGVYGVGAGSESAYYSGVNIVPILAAAAGAAIGREIIFGYYERKQARNEITMVRDRKGRFVDSAKLFERKMFYGYLAVIVMLAIAGNTILMA